MEDLKKKNITIYRLGMPAMEMSEEEYLERQKKEPSAFCFVVSALLSAIFLLLI